MKLFVWRTLIRGECNAGKMTILGGKYIRNHTYYNVDGELYDIPEGGFKELVRFEGTANFIPAVIGSYYNMETRSTEPIYMFVQSPNYSGNSWYMGYKIRLRKYKSRRK